MVLLCKMVGPLDRSSSLLGVENMPMGQVIVQELCESRGGRPGLSVLTSLVVSVDVKHHVYLDNRSEFRSCVRVEVAVLGCPS